MVSSGVDSVNLFSYYWPDDLANGLVVFFHVF